MQTGLEQFIAASSKGAAGRRLGLLCNPASVDRHYMHARDLIRQRFPGRLKALYSPQHGFFAQKQDNMIESADAVDPVSGLPVFSLYADTRIPTEEMLAPIDVLIVDLQDVGTRVYTFIYTLSYCLESAKRFGKQVVVLDRPNPLGGQTVEGNCLHPAWASFVGRYPIPMRHGLTVGELAMYFNDMFDIGSDLVVVPMKGWRRSMTFQDTGLPWVAPSPNLPTPASAMVYPGQVIWEGTAVSEGRGTTQPFELFGAPFIDTARVLNDLGGPEFPGAILRPAVFEPTANKWQGRACNGFQLHVTRPELFSPYETSLRILQSVIRCHGDRFEWKPPPYEYEFERLPIDLILGDREIRRRIERFDPIADIAASWRQGLDEFERKGRVYHLYH